MAVTADLVGVPKAEFRVRANPANFEGMAQGLINPRGVVFGSDSPHVSGGSAHSQW